ncbi:MAG TPA: amidohydrolase family protein [Chitinophagaceae bacterium]|nr:amidohydrolase family protein [Chitinophagaceae bacterium]
MNYKATGKGWAVTTAICIVSLTNYGQLTSPVYDVVITGGHVLDPETRLDTIKNVGILGSRIAEISSAPLTGKEVINASGLVVAPGFIDLHVHGRGVREQEFKLHDGVTTMLELEWGIEFPGEWYESRKGNSLINFGGSACWPFERFKALNKYPAQLSALEHLVRSGKSGIDSLMSNIRMSYDDTLSAAQMNLMLQNIRRSLAEGAIGIGVPIGYLPAVKAEEVFRVYQLGGELKATIFTHVREGGIAAVQQAIADAVLTGAPLHIVHMNSATLGKIYFGIELVEQARKKGFDITTEVYPYTAASTLLQSAVFDEGWQQRLGINYGDLQWVATGERLTKETFERYRKTNGIVIIHSMQPEWIRDGVTHPNVIIASDAMPYAPLAHPRTAGTYARVLGKYVREDKAMDLMTAIEKMTLLPARRLQEISPTMRYKGRIQIGADADITIFNPLTIIDKATFDKGLAFSEGIEYVIVNGTLVLNNGKTVSNTFPGQPVYGKYKK